MALGRAEQHYNVLRGEGVVAKPEWGAKRSCLNCGTKFYDFTRDPIVCPSCETSYNPGDFKKPKRAPRAESKAAAVAVVEAATVEVAADGPVDEKAEVAADGPVDENAEVAADDNADQAVEVSTEEVLADEEKGADDGDENDEVSIAVEEGLIDDDDDEEDEDLDNVLDANVDDNIEAELDTEIDTTKDDDVNN